MKLKDLRFKHMFMIWPVYFILAVLIDMYAVSEYGTLSGYLLLFYWLFLTMFYVSLFAANLIAYKKDTTKLSLVFAVAAAILLVNHIIRVINLF
jgi:hypothetical protein